MVKAAESVHRRAVSEKDAVSRFFVKAEKVRRTAAKWDPAPRIINPRDPRYNVSLGRFLHKLEKRIYKRIKNIWGDPTVMKGYNARQTAQHMAHKWFESGFKQPCGIGLDASRFDQHISADALRWEHSVYASFFAGEDRTELLRLLGMQLQNRGVARVGKDKVKYTVDGVRMSGDMNTALGNCLLMCAMVWTLCRELNIRAKLANNGDDCMLICEAEDKDALLAAIPNWFKRYGFTMKVEDPVFEFEHLEFCQTRPVWGPDGWIMCRDPRVAISKDVVTTLPLNQGKIDRKLLGAIGNCGLALGAGLPVFQEFYTAMLRNADGTLQGAPQLEGGFFWMSRGLSPRYVDISPKSRYSFWRAFGIEPAMQRMLESGSARWTYCPGRPREVDISTDFTVSPSWFCPQFRDYC
jgi:hypothetical protein